MIDKYSESERKLNGSIILAFMCAVGLAALSAFNVLYWAIWVPGIIALAGVVVSNAMQLNRIDELRTRHE